MNDLEDRLRGRQRLEDVGSDGALFDARDERLGRSQRNVRLEQRDPDFAQRFVDLALGDPPPSAQAIENRA